jgi:hypothetical protein
MSAHGSTTQLYNIGPDAIADAGVDGGPGFTLSRPEWIALQTYCTNAAALPTTPEAFRKSLGDGAPPDLSDFTQLISAYKVIGTHTADWTKTTYPAAVALAGDVYQYGTSKVPSYYPQLLAEAKVLTKDPSDEQAKAALKAILDHLKSDTDGRAKRAGEVVNQISRFAADTETDRATLVGGDGNGGLVKYYNDKYGQASKEVEKLAKDLVDEGKVLNEANAEYDHDVVVATTTPTYAWIWPFGTVAAAVVAGVYGRRAVEALERARAAEAKIATLHAKLAADARLMVALHGAETGMGAIVGNITESLPVIQKMQGVWGGISADLAALASMVDDDIRNVAPIIMELGIEATVRAWANVAAAANAFRIHAYVKEDPRATMIAWKVRTQFASPSTLAA